jgi:transcriptional regulator with XRE-family HTH domain
MKINLGFIGKNIRYLRRERGWTLAKLAAKAGMSEVPLGRIERNVNAPSASAIYSLSKALNVSVDTLFAEEHESFRLHRFEDEKKPFLIAADLEDTFTPQLKSMAQDIVLNTELFLIISNCLKARDSVLLPFPCPKP